MGRAPRNRIRGEWDKDISFLIVMVQKFATKKLAALAAQKLAVDELNFTVLWYKKILHGSQTYVQLGLVWFI
jgi:hypothetical protein